LVVGGTHYVVNLVRLDQHRCVQSRARRDRKEKETRKEASTVKQDDPCDAVPEAAPTADFARRWLTGPSVEAYELRAQLKIIVQLFHHLDAALDDLGYEGDQAPCQLSHQVRAEMIHRWVIDVSERLPSSGFSAEQVAELRRQADNERR
jgi:hypothetical protein